MMVERTLWKTTDAKERALDFVVGAFQPILAEIELIFRLLR